jgi:asparagine synthase (glutamine-hydrolysing)
MCGIAGIVDFTGNFPIRHETLTRMSESIAHRGPDGQRIWLNYERDNSRPHPPDAGPQVGFVFRRLAVLDPDPRAMQPMSTPDNRFTLVFNGEIYNFRELRQKLDSKLSNHTWRTTGDSEVLLMAYATWGPECLAKLDGMYAFAVWDAHDRTMFLARDPAGQKPLYVTKLHGPPVNGVHAGGAAAIAFASELAALRELDWFDDTIDPSALRSYLRLGYVPAPRTIYKCVDKHSAGSSELVSADKRKISSTTSCSFNKDHRNPDQLTAKTRDLLTAAVRRQLVSDVPLGCWLSGGIDSSVIAAAMKSAASPDQKVLTFSIGFDDPRYDETPYAQAVAAHLGTEHRSFNVRPDAAADLPRLAEVFGEPFGDSSALPTHYLARETRQFVTVALSGDGGDELFGGYDRYRAMALAARIDQSPATRALLTHQFWQSIPGTHPKSRRARLKRFLSALREKNPQARYQQMIQLFDDTQIDALLSPPDEQATLERETDEKLFEFELSKNPDIVAAVAEFDRRQYLPDDIHTKVDRASMLHALEVRAPFMDSALLAFARTLTGPDLLAEGPKHLLRRAFAADLPPQVFTRPKMGFALPIGDWFRTSLKSMLRDHLFAADSFASKHLNRPALDRLLTEHDHNTADHGQRLYALLMLELWWRSTRRH